MYVIVNGKNRHKVTVTQVRASIRKHGSWSGYTKGNKLNTMYDPLTFRKFTSLEELNQFIEAWNYYNVRDYGYLWYYTA